MTEKQIETMILDFLSYQRGYYWKNNSVGIYDPVKKLYRKAKSKYAINGTSDILGVLPDGKLVAIEVKALKGRLSASQSEFLNNIKINGGVAFVAKCLRDVQDNLEAYLK